MHKLISLAVVLLPVAVLASPAPRSAPLPSADRLTTRIRLDLDGRAEVQVRLCVAADGHLTSAELLRSSSLTAFDDAVMKDVALWRFAPAPAASCAVRKIDYDARL